MIHKISIENFFSVAERQDLDFRVSANAPDLGNFRESRGNSEVRLPLVVGIYGPNASGKTTALRALTTTAWFVQQSFASVSPNNSITPFMPYAHNDWCNRPTKIVVDYDSRLEEKALPALFRYEIHINHESTNFGKEVAYESLSYAPKGKFRRIFERNLQEFTFGREFGITHNDSRVKSIRSNASLISTLAQLNHKFSTDLIFALRALQTNLTGFEKAQNVLNGALTFYSQHPDYLQHLNRELSRLDLGLEEMKILPGNPGPLAMFKHFGLDRDIGIILESAGTRRFIEIFPMLQFL